MKTKNHKIIQIERGGNSVDVCSRLTVAEFLRKFVSRKNSTGGSVLCLGIEPTPCGKFIWVCVHFENNNATLIKFINVLLSA